MDSRYAHLGYYGKPLGPQDCGSWMSRLLELKRGMSTYDFAKYHRDQIAGLTDGKKIQPVRVGSIYDVRPGMILCTRCFDLSKDPQMNTTLGTPGHVALIVDVDCETQTLVTLEAVRELPQCEGFGVRRIWFHQRANEKHMFFSVNE